MTHPLLDNDQHRQAMAMLRAAHTRYQASKSGPDWRAGWDSYLVESSDAHALMMQAVPVDVSPAFERKIRASNHCEPKYTPKLVGYVLETLDGREGASYQCSGCWHRCGWGGPGCDLQHFQLPDTRQQLSLLDLVGAS